MRSQSESGAQRRESSRAQSERTSSHHIQLSDDVQDDGYNSFYSSNGGRLSRKRRTNDRRAFREYSAADQPNLKQQRNASVDVRHASYSDHRFAYSTVYNLASRLPSFGEHNIQSAASSHSSARHLNQNQRRNITPSPARVDSTVFDMDTESLVVSEPSFLREFEDKKVMQSKSAALIYVLNVIRDLLRNTENKNLALELERHCNVPLPFDVSEEFSKIELNIARKPYLDDPGKYARLEKDMPVKSFLWIVRDLSHHGRDNYLYAEDLVDVLMSKKALFHKLIPKILRWADNHLRPQFESELGLHLNFLGKHFRKLENDESLQSISLVVKCESFPYGQRLQRFKGTSFQDFKTFLSQSTKIDEENMACYRLHDSQKFALLDFTDVEDGMTCVVEVVATAEVEDQTRGEQAV